MYDGYRKWTATNLFIVPTLGVNRRTLIENGLINAYIKDEMRGIDYERGIYLLFQPLDLDKFNEFLEEERKRKVIVDEYDYPDRLTIVVYQHDKQWNDDVALINKGKFSQVSESYKEKIPKTSKIDRMGITKEVLNIQHQVFKKSPSLAEYWKDAYGLDLNYKTDEFWEFYPTREILSEETLKKII